VSACGAVAFLALAIRYHGAVTYGRFDGWVNGRVPPRRDLPIRTLAPLTDVAPTIFVVLACAAAVALLLARWWRGAALAVLGPGLTLLVVEIGKFAVGRLHEGALSLPSGHTAAVTSVSLVAVLLLVARVRGHRMLAATVGALVVTAVAGAMAFLLVALRWHYATDTIAGYCVAVAGTLAAAFAVDAIPGRWVPATVRRSVDRVVDRLVGVLRSVR
jgi:undecaprenyl-diphosphatase